MPGGSGRERLDAEAPAGAARARREPGVRLGVLAVMVVTATLVSFVRPATAAFPGANGSIAFESNRDGNVEIYAMSPDGGNQVNFSNNPSGSDSDPAWNRDATRIAYTRGSDIWVMNADGAVRPT